MQCELQKSGWLPKCCAGRKRLCVHHKLIGAMTGSGVHVPKEDSDLGDDARSYYTRLTSRAELHLVSPFIQSVHW